MVITICGGGSLGHVCAGVFSSRGNEVRILSGHPEKWNQFIQVTDEEGRVYKGKLSKVSSNPELVIPNSDIVLLCTPGFLIRKNLEAISPYVTTEMTIGSIVSSTGFFFEAHRIFSKNICLFGFQRVPYIARILEYGVSAALLGYKKTLYVAIENSSNSQCLLSKLSNLVDTPIVLLESFYEAALTNSNPILHTGRLYSMWKNWNGTPFKEQSYFYGDWDDSSSDMILKMDAEFQILLKTLNVRNGAIPTLLDYYESNNACELTSKLRSITAFQTILSPMTYTENGWIPDFTSRYFTEDFPYGLRYIKELSKEHRVNTPIIDKVYSWGIEISKA
jgi:hypothetical protein